MSAPLYSLEEGLERSVVQTLQGITALSGLRIVPADRSDETELPMISVRAEKLDEVVLGMGTWNARIAATLTTAADETEEEEIAARRLPDAVKDDEGATGFKREWKILSDTMTSASFQTSLNSHALAYVWGLEAEPVAYENNERTFARTASARVWCNEAYPSPQAP
jgi:hypothetical protein